MESKQGTNEKTDMAVVQEVSSNLGDSKAPTPESSDASPVSEVIEGVKDIAKTVLPDTPPVNTQLAVDPIVVKERLEKGEPALTIIDIRERSQFNSERITGAVSMPMETLVEQAQSSLSSVRDIYVYGESDTSVAKAAKNLRKAGFSNVAEIKGNLGAWKSIGAPVEGSTASV